MTIVNRSSTITAPSPLQSPGQLSATAESCIAQSSLPCGAYEVFQGKTVSEGDVKVFRVRGHPQAQFAYAWTREDADGTKHHVAVLDVPPIG